MCEYYSSKENYKLKLSFSMHANPPLSMLASRPKTLLKYIDHLSLHLEFLDKLVGAFNLTCYRRWKVSSSRNGKRKVNKSVKAYGWGGAETGVLGAAVVVQLATGGMVAGRAPAAWKKAAVKLCAPKKLLVGKTWLPLGSGEGCFGSKAFIGDLLECSSSQIVDVLWELNNVWG
jgi:hypothetical protein